MTNKEVVEEESAIEPHLAAFLAVHLVTQVLDEAHIIANAAKDSGQPWRYLTILKNLRSGKLGDPDDDYSFVAPQTNFVNNVEYVVNNLATSTPQKLPDNLLKAIDDSLIGQASEDDFESPQSNLSKATSMFINHLFDMSEVEHIYEEDPNENNVEHSETYDVKNVSMYRIVTSCVDAAINLATAENASGIVFDNCKQNLFGDSIDNKTSIPLNDAFNTEGEVPFYVEDDRTTPEDANKKDSKPSVVNESGDAAFRQGNHDILEKRDEDSCPEPEDDPETHHREQKILFMHDIELQTETNKDDKFGLTDQETKGNQVENLEATASADFKKGSLVLRFRTRILARLRRWWRRRTPGRRMEYQVQRAARDLCPQSPSPRRRVSSLRGNRHVFSPSPSSSALWKFNTVNEGVVSTWKEYSFESKPSRLDEK